jgi:hypothetical protein
MHPNSTEDSSRPTVWDANASLSGTPHEARLCHPPMDQGSLEER